jgi:transketolase
MKETEGPVALRLAREATPVVTCLQSPFELGKANVIRYRGAQKTFRDAFDVCLSGIYQSEDEDLSIISCGPVLAEAMRAALILKEEYNIEARVLNMHTVKPIDKDSITRAADETKVILTVEEHQVGGFGNIIAGVAAKHAKSHFKFDMMGIEDRFGESGAPWELMKIFALTAEFIALKAKKLYSN